MPRPPLVPEGPPLGAAERARYARHLLLPGLGASGQRRLRAASVLVVGAGGLGSPTLLYLAAAGVGRLAVVDDDVVEPSNLQRQVVHRTADVGSPKTASAARAVRDLDPGVEVLEHRERLDSSTALDLLAEHDLVVDGADTFPTRYLVGDACARLGMPHVWGAVYRYDAQASVWWAGEGPCYRCVFPVAPAPDAVPSCATGGVLGATCGTIGSVLVTEVVKLVTGTGDPLVGRLLLHDALRQEWGTVPVAADPACPVCGPGADPLAPLGYAVPPAATWVVPDPGRGATGVAPTGQEVGGRSEPLPSVEVGVLAARLAARDRGTDDFVLLDVREPGEREVVTIPGAVPVPLGDLREGRHADMPADRPVLVHCRSGARSAEAVALLRERGVDAVDVSGGVLAWVRDVDPSLPTY
ncbi:MAG TPA: ThiF family adenylyltransferase [Dermatophilaceae bacterium]|nr:ThiF family adenylyltransferase [Dermatophilaceae bacterium]